MILFLEDWKKYPGAAPNYATTNTTWVRLAGVYHKMGIKNCLFHLALVDQRLVNIDPHSKNLTEQEVAMIIDEIAINPWYMLREIIRVPPVAGVDPVPLRANRGNIGLYWLFHNHITSMLILPRQTGKSVAADANTVSLLTGLCVNTDISLLTKDDALRVKNVKRIKDMISCLPEYLHLRSNKDTNNTEKVTIQRLGNTLLTAVAQASKKAALNLGRGMTNAINVIDEFAFINNIKTTLSALLASAGAARDEAKLLGAPHGTIFTTTPGYLSSESGEFAHRVYNDSFRWSEKIFDTKDNEEAVNMVVKNSSSGKEQVVIDLNHRQLGYTDEWLRKKISDAMAEGSSIEAEFLNIWPDGTSTSIISKEKLKLIKDSIINDPRVDVSTYGYIIRWFVTEDKLSNMLVVAGLDTSDAVGEDGIGLIMRDVATGAVVGSGDFNETNTITFAKWLADFLISHPNILLIPERKSTGISIIDALIEILLHNDVDPFTRIFNWVVNDYKAKETYSSDVINCPFSRRDPSVYVKYRKQFGYATAGAGRSSRTMLYGEIFNASISYTADSVRDSKLVNQLSGLVVKNNRIDHGSGNHDDLVIAWLLCHWFLAKAENLSFYNIPTHKVLTSVAEAVIEEQGGAEAVEAKEYQLELKAEIDELIDKLKEENVPLRRAMITNKLRYLYRDVDVNIIQVFNLDTLLNSIEQDRNKKRY